MNCDIPILTDSGGFQVMSLSKLNKIDREKGAIFNSHVDGKKIILSPEESIKIQLWFKFRYYYDYGWMSQKQLIMINKKSMNYLYYWAERSKMLLEIIHKKLYLELFKVVYLKILELKVIKELIK